MRLAALLVLAQAAWLQGAGSQPAWHYEPREWHFDEQLAELGPADLGQPDDWQRPHEDHQRLQQVPSGRPAQWAQDGRAGEGPSERELRASSNFWTADRWPVEREFERRMNTSRRNWIRQQRDEQASGEQQQQQQQLRCTQFRVDIRETVICDGQRCDKFDFEWPKHDNQIVHIETTRHGMRFYRAEYAFATSAARAPGARGQPEAEPQARRRELARPPSTEHKVGQREQVLARPPSSSQLRAKPVKFDLFELFKPKPSTVAPIRTPLPVTEPSSSPDTPAADGQTSASSTEAPQSSSSPKAPSSQQVTQGQPTAEPAPPGDEKEDKQEGASAAAANGTRLVTTLRVSTRHRKQSILGFGGALSDSTCRNVKSLSQAMEKSLMEDYYGQRGLRYNIARMSMGSSDFSTTAYTNNDAPLASDRQLSRQQSLSAINDDDVEMKRFRLVDEDFEFKLPVARQAIATSRQQLRFFSSLWSPPIWMKNNSNIVHGWLKGDVYGPYYKALADYIVKWLEAYRKQGIEFWATTGLNEPITGVQPFIFHNSLGITRDDYVTFIKLYLGPMLHRRGFADLKLIIMDDNKGYASNWARAVLRDEQAAKYVSGIGVHWYMNDEYENLNALINEHPDRFILSTEACNGYLPYQVHTLPGNWDRGVAYMYDIIKMMQKNAVGWVDWNMVLDVSGGPSWAKNNLDAPIIVNAQRDEYYKSPTFYAIGHFSKFLEPNSTRLDHRLANARYDRPLEAVSFITPKGFIVIIALNTNRHPVPFRVIVDQQLVRIVTLRQESFNSIIFRWPNSS